MTLPGSAREAVRSSALITWRNLLHTWREPGVVVSNVFTSVVLVLLFAFVLGGGLGGPEYPEYLMPGLFGQSAAFVVLYTTVALAFDMDKGVVDRFRSLPISRIAVIVGRCASDVGLVVTNLAILTVCGLAIGWTVRTDVGSVALGYLLMVLFAFSMSWLASYLGLVCKRVEVAQSVGIMWVFPFTFLSSALVSPEFMVEPFRTIAKWNPLSALCDSTRLLFGNGLPRGYVPSTGWVAENPVLYLLLCCVGLVAVFGTLTVRLYGRLDHH